jgi:quinol monooxygenase YgiN
MLVVAGRIELDPKHRNQAIAAAFEMMRATRAEAGCRSYVFSAELDDPGVFRIFEEWESEAALHAHFQTPHMARFQQAIGALGVKNVAVQRYDVSKVGPVR